MRLLLCFNSLARLDVSNNSFRLIYIVIINAPIYEVKLSFSVGRAEKHGFSKTRYFHFIFYIHIRHADKINRSFMIL